MNEEATTIHDLLPEVLIKIFKKLKKDSDLKSVQHTCHYWYELVDKRVGRRIGLGNDYTCVPCCFTFMHPVNLSQVGVQSCFIDGDEDSSDEEWDSSSEDDDDPQNEPGGELSKDGEVPSGVKSREDDVDEELKNPHENVGQGKHQNENENKEEHQDTTEEELEMEKWRKFVGGGLKYPYLLKDLYLHGWIPPPIFVILVEHARNLSGLEISLYTFIKLRNNDLKNLAFLKLAALVVKMGYYGQPPGFIPNLKTLLTENRFPRLTRLSIELAKACFADLSITRMLVTFVQDHKALREFRVYLNMITEDIDIYENGTPPEPVPVPPINYELMTITHRIRERGDCHLRDLHIFNATNQPLSTHGTPFSGPIEIINELLLNVVSLETLRLKLEPLPNSTLQSICARNAATLRDLHIYSDHSGIDCSAFSALQVCQEMSVCSQHHGAIGISHLPSTLTSLSIWGPIDQADANHILFDLPNIKDIELGWVSSDDGVRDGSCITLEMLRRFNDNRRVDRLRVTRDCLADRRSSPREGVPNNDPSNPQMLDVYLIADLADLEWKLNETGLYTNGLN